MKAQIDRLKIISLVLILFLVVIIIKMIYLTYLGYVKDVNINSFINKYEVRNDILDREGNVIALSIPSTSIYINPYLVKDKRNAKLAMMNILGLTEERANSLLNSKSSFVWVKRNITKNEQILLKYKGILGLYFQEEKKRFYPYGRLFSHVVGITDIDGNGISGVEHSYNNILYTSSVKLSLDLKLQVILYEALEKALLNNKAKSAYGIIVDPNTAEVLAMVSLPDFDPNTREDIDKGMFNHVVQGVVEPGSISKVFSLAIALDSKTTDIRDIVDVSIPIVKNKYLIVDYSYINRKITVPEILMYSSNVGSSILMNRAGSSIQREYLKNLGILDKPPIELEEKEGPLVSKNWDDLSTMTISYGYGISMSQATFVNSFNALVNGGLLRPLTLEYKNKLDNKEGVRVVSKKVSDEMLAMLRLTVAYGFGKRAELNGYRVGGKTGSAEKVVNGRYSMNTVIASFLGVFPTDNPKYTILISIDEPKRVAYNNYNVTGGTLAAPVISQIIENIVISKGIPKKEEDLPKDLTSDSIISYVTNDKESKHL